MADGTRSCHVLVIDDDLDICEAITEILTDEGYRVSSAHDGAEGLRKLRAGLAPCLILLDVMMPIMDGWTFRNEQLSDPALAALPVVVMTADGHANHKAATMRAASALPKPSSALQLLEVVSRFCSDRAGASGVASADPSSSP